MPKILLTILIFATQAIVAGGGRSAGQCATGIPGSAKIDNPLKNREIKRLIEKKHKITADRDSCGDCLEKMASIVCCIPRTCHFIYQLMRSDF